MYRWCMEQSGWRLVKFGLLVKPSPFTKLSKIPAYKNRLSLFHSPLESIIEEAWGQYPLKARRCVGLLLIKIVSFKVNLNYYQMINNVNMTFMSCWQFWDDCNIISLTYNLKYNLACNTSCFRDQPSIIALYQSWIII